jgi:hypothetical protein
MHKVEIRFTHEGDAPSAMFEVYTECLKDGNYVELAPMRKVASDATPIVMFLEGDERVIVVAKADEGRMVYDKDQNANVRVPTEAERTDREARDANIAKSQADQAVRTAHAKAGENKELSAKTDREDQKEIRKAEEAKTKLEAEQTKSRPPVTSGISMASAAQGAPKPGAPASVNTGPVDSKQVKRD